MRKAKSQPKFQPSPEQAAILQLPLTSGSITVIKAFAGTGKTATLRMIAESRPDRRILYIVYNKAMAEEAKKTFPANVQVRTSHSLAFEICGKRYGDNLGPLRSKDISAALHLPPITSIEVVDTLNHWFHSIDPEIEEAHLPTDCENRPKVLESARRTWSSISGRTVPIPMPHDGYQKLWSLSNPSCGTFDLVFADEAHDLNPVVLDFAFRSASKDNAAVVFVGDPHQSIYSWRGAIDAIPTIEARAAGIARLTWSFRFGSSIAKDATTILRHLKSEEVNVVGAGTPNQDTDRLCILARTNFTLIEHALDELTHEPTIALHFAGTKATEKWSPRTPYRFHDLLDVLHLYEGRRDQLKTPYFKRFKSWQELVDFADAGDQEIEWLIKIVAKYKSELPLSLKLLEKNVVAQDQADITYSTAHRSKGLEWDYVEVMNDFIPPDKILAGLATNKTPNEVKRTLLEEANLHYVSFTRARRKLTLSSQLRTWLKANED